MPAGEGSRLNLLVQARGPGSAGAAAPFIDTANFLMNMLNGGMDAADPDALVTIKRFNATAVTSLVATTFITATGTKLGFTRCTAGD